MPGVLDGLFGEHHPLLVAHVCEQPLPRHGLGEILTATCEGQVALAIEVGQSCEVQSPKAAREDTDGQEEVRPTREPLGPVRRQASRRQDTVEMGVMVELLAPGMEHGEPADLCAEMLGVPGDVLKRLRDRAKEEPIEQTRVLQRQGTQVVRQGKDPMDVWRVEHLALPGREPRGLGRAMAFGAAAMPA